MNDALIRPRDIYLLGGDRPSQTTRLQLFPIELCPDALYMQLTGKPVEEVIPGLASQADQDALPDFPQP